MDFLYVGSAQSRMSAERTEAKIDRILAQVLGHEEGGHVMRELDAEFRKE